MAASVNSEDLIGKRFDKCLTDGIIKFGGGTVIGAVLSLLFFKRRRWPILVGAGMGIGMAYRSCEINVNDLFNSPSFHGNEGKLTDSATGEFILPKKK